MKSFNLRDFANSLRDAGKDSYKDMENNFEGLHYGLTNSEEDCKTWLRDLDMEKNIWKK